MSNRVSLHAVILIAVSFVCFRLCYFHNNDKNGYNATNWDAFGYYMYLPSTFIYQDAKELKWVDKVDSTYDVTGGVFYQAIKLESGSYTNKYLCGIAIMQAPFFFIGHIIAFVAQSPQDGFSSPYQYAIMLGALFWGIMGFAILRKVLLQYFNDQTTAVTLLLLALCSNLIQYISVDAAQSHIWIFTLYSFLIWLTIKWHENPKWTYALLIGLICGLAVISRPTEIIIIFIPLLWQTNDRESKLQKWALVGQHKLHIVIAIIGGFAGILPQLMYWKYTTGTFIFDVGSKWYFLNPWFRVLFGPEKGWFLYTPIAILMVLGLSLMKKYPFQKSVMAFCLLNLWIIMAWSDWRYGGSYSTRALVQSYPVFTLAMACLVHLLLKKNKTVLLYSIGILLILLNFYQLQIYNSGVGEGFSPFLNRIKL
jgi:hypothetical protein